MAKQAGPSKNANANDQNEIRRAAKARQNQQARAAAKSKKGDSGLENGIFRAIKEDKKALRDRQREDREVRRLIDGWLDIADGRPAGAVITKLDDPVFVRAIVELLGYVEGTGRENYAVLDHKTSYILARTRPVRVPKTS